MYVGDPVTGHAIDPTSGSRVEKPLADDRVVAGAGAFIKDLNGGPPIAYDDARQTSTTAGSLTSLWPSSTRKLSCTTEMSPDFPGPQARAAGPWPGSAGPSLVARPPQLGLWC